MKKTILGLSLVALGWAAFGLTSTGCDQATCQDVQRNYERNVRAERSMAPLSEEGAPHLVMAMRLDLFNDLAGGLISTALNQALNSSGTLRVSGQSVPYQLSSAGANLRFDASSACNTCLRVRGDLDGRVAATLPVVGQAQSPLSGTIDWTLPLGIGRDNDGKVSLFIDTAEAVNMGVPAITGQLSSLPSTWAQPVANALIADLAAQVASRIPPVRLVGFDVPNLGLAGLEITPSLFRFDSSSNALILGVRTNLPVQGGRSEAEVLQALRLQDGQNIALGVQPDAILESVRLGMQQNRIARQYTLNGEASPNGTAHALVDALSISSHSRDRNAMALGLDFRLFNFGGMGCFSMNGEAASRLAIENGRVALQVEDVAFSGSPFAGMANWTSAQFIQRTGALVTASLNEDVVFSPEVGMSLRGDRVGAEAGMLVLRGAGAAGSTPPAAQPSSSPSSTPSSTSEPTPTQQPSGTTGGDGRPRL